MDIKNFLDDDSDDSSEFLDLSGLIGPPATSNDLPTTATSNDTSNNSPTTATTTSNGTSNGASNNSPTITSNGASNNSATATTASPNDSASDSTNLSSDTHSSMPNLCSDTHSMPNLSDGDELIEDDDSDGDIKMNDMIGTSASGIYIYILYVRFLDVICICLFVSVNIGKFSLTNKWIRKLRSIDSLDQLQALKDTVSKFQVSEMKWKFGM